MEICDLLSEIAHYAAQLTQNQYFTFMYCLGTVLIFSYLYRRKYLEGKRIVQACNDATRDVKLESLDENGSPAAGLDSQNVNEFPSAGKRYKEIIFKYNFSGSSGFSVGS